MVVCPKLYFILKEREVNGQSDSEIIVNSKIMIGIVIGTTLGFLVPEWTFISVLGELFVGALKAAPILVFVLIIASLAQQKAGAKTYVGSLVVYLRSDAVVAVTASYLFPVKIVLEAAQEAQAATQLSDVFKQCVNKRCPKIRFKR